MPLPVPATNYETLFDLKTHIEEAVKTVLIARGLTNVTRSREDVVLDTPRVTVIFTKGQAMSQRRNIPAGVTGRVAAVPVAWEGALRLAVTTSRVLNASSHDENVAKISFIMNCCGVKDFTTTLLPYHQIMDMVDAGVQDSHDTASEQDESVIMFGVRVAIRHEAWPATATP